MEPQGTYLWTSQQECDKVLKTRSVQYMYSNLDWWDVAKTTCQDRSIARALK